MFSGIAMGSVFIQLLKHIIRDLIMYMYQYMYNMQCNYL